MCLFKYHRPWLIISVSLEWSLSSSPSHNYPPTPSLYHCFWHLTMHKPVSCNETILSINPRLPGFHAISRLPLSTIGVVIVFSGNWTSPMTWCIYFFFRLLRRSILSGVNAINSVSLVLIPFLFCFFGCRDLDLCAVWRELEIRFWTWFIFSVFFALFLSVFLIFGSSVILIFY